MRVTANEGAEGTVTDLGVGTFTVAIPQPSLTMREDVDGVVGSGERQHESETHSARRRSVRHHRDEQRAGTVDANTLVITDPIPADTTMYVATTPANPVVFVNGTTASGLTFAYASNVSYSSVGVSGPWTYTPVPDVNGFDAKVRAVRVSPGGIMSAAGAGNPSFTVQFRVRIN